MKGLSFSPSDHESEDGDLGAMVNLLNEDGALKAITLGGGNVVGEIPSECSIAAVHKNGFTGGGYCHWILDCVTDGVHTWKWVEKDGTGADDDNHIFSIGFDVNSVSCMGNMVIFIGDNDTKYALWRDGAYVLFSMQDFKYSIDLRAGKMVSNSYTADMGDDFYGCFICSGGGSEDEHGYPSSTITKVVAKKEGVPNIFNAVIAKQNEALSGVAEEMHRNITLGVCAVRLYDGSLLNVGGPFVLAPHTTRPLMSVQRSSTSVTMSLSAHQHHIKVTMNAAERLGNIISGINVYLTIGDLYLDVDRAYQLDLTSGTSTNFEGSFSFVRKSGKKLYDAIDGEVFNLATTVTPDEIGTWKELPHVTGAEEAMTLSDFRRGSYGALYSYVYNKRLHLAGVTQTIGSPFLPEIRMWYPFAQNGQISEFFDNHPDAAIPVDQNSQMTGTPLRVDVAMKVTGDFGGDTSEYCFKGYASFPLSPILSFPHTGAKEADLYVRITGSDIPNGNGVWHRHFTLHPSESWGMSYYVDADDNGWKLMQLNDYTIISYYDPSTMTSALRSEWESVTDAVMQAVEAKAGIASYNESKSLLKVSEVNNPLVFPVSNSVEVGSGEILGMASNTEPISEGQFGAYPLHVFTDEGVWALELSDTGTYRSRQPSSRDVITDARSITPIDKGVLFATKRGLMIIRGNQVECLTDNLRGIPWDFSTLPHSVDVLGGIDMEAVQYDRIEQMMKDARMLYDYARERVYVYRESDAYALVLSLRSGLWGVVENGGLTGGVPWYPETYILRATGDGKKAIVDLSDMEHEIDMADVMCCTRPLSLGAREMHKSVMHAVVRGLAHMRGSGEESRLGCAIWGSNDLYHWFAVNSSTNQYLRGRYGQPYKWWRIAIVGRIDPGETIDGVTMDVKVRLNNRLR